MLSLWFGKKLIETIECVGCYFGNWGFWLGFVLIIIIIIIFYLCRFLEYHHALGSASDFEYHCKEL